MSWWKRSTPRPPREEAMDREIGFHIAELTEAYIAQGLSPQEADRRAKLEFGGREQVKQTIREVHISALLEHFGFNLRAAIRFLRKSPGFSLVVILTLALGIGANSAVFSAIDAVVLRPLPFPKGNQLVALYQRDVKGRDANRFVAPVRLEDWNRLNSTFQSISGYYFDDLSETSGPLPEKVTEALVAPRFLQVMGVSPALGREFTPQEEHWGGPDAVVISYKFWQRRFHGDQAALWEEAPRWRLLLLHRGGYAGIVPVSKRRCGSVGSQRSRCSLCGEARCDVVYGNRAHEARSYAGTGSRRSRHGAKPARKAIPETRRRTQS